MRYELIRSEEGTYPITMMCRLLEVSRPAYYKWKSRQNLPPGPRAARRNELSKHIEQIWIGSHRLYGARRIHAELLTQGWACSVWLVRKLMAELDIHGLQPRSFTKTTIQADDADTRRDRLGRAFYPPVATTHLVGDITYLKTGEGWLYLATVIDLTTRMVIGWATGEHLHTSLVVDALAMAWRAGLTAGGAIFHSDRGSQYTSREFAQAARRMDIRLSVGRTGVCWDNAVAESFFASLKKERWYRHPCPATRAKARAQVADYIEVFYNRARRHSTIGYQIPAIKMSNFHNHINPTLHLAAA